MDNTVEQFQVGALSARIVVDYDPYNPREDDNMGTLVCWHRRYVLGDEQPSSDPHDWFEYHKDEFAVVLPLYLYDHGGVTMNTRGFHCPWDSGQVGWAYVTFDDVRREYGVVDDDTLAKAKAVLEGEVRVYDAYISGQIYGFVVEDEQGEHLESCYGFFGFDELDYLRAEARDTAEAIEVNRFSSLLASCSA